MSEDKKRKIDWIREVAKDFPSLDVNSVKAKVEELSGEKVSKTYVKRIMGRIEREEAPPEISVELPELPPLEEEGEEEEEGFEIPPEMPPEEPEAIAEPSEIDRLRPIFQRSVKRLGDVVIQRFAKVKEGSISRQEAIDTEILVFAIIAKYGHIALEAYYLEVTSLMHFSSLALRTLAQRREQREKEKEREKPTPPPTPSREEEKPKEETPRLFKKGETRPKWMEEGSLLEGA